MSGDLISRSALLKEINGDENKKADTLMREWYADMVKRQPIAYDVDKVVERLKSELSFSGKEKERCAEESPLQFYEAKGYERGTTVALEIVKSGGIE